MQYAFCTPLLQSHVHNQLLCYAFHPCVSLLTLRTVIFPHFPIPTPSLTSPSLHLPSLPHPYTFPHFPIPTPSLTSPSLHLPSLSHPYTFPHFPIPTPPLTSPSLHLPSLPHPYTSPHFPIPTPSLTSPSLHLPSLPHPYISPPSSSLLTQPVHTIQIVCVTVCIILLLPPTPQVTGEPLSHRSDDNEATLRQRLTTYHTQTTPLVGYYQKQGIHSRIDASKPPEQVLLDVEAIFKRCTAKPK